MKLLLSEVDQGKLIREIATNMSTSINMLQNNRVELKDGQHFWVLNKAEDFLALRKILLRLYQSQLEEQAGETGDYVALDMVL